MTNFYLSKKLTNYFHTSTTPQKCINYLTKLNGGKIKYDHMAFRSINFQDFNTITNHLQYTGYLNMNETIDIPIKNKYDSLKYAHWFKDSSLLIPRVFLSIAQLTPQHNNIIKNMPKNEALRELKKLGDDYVFWTYLYEDEINHVAIDLSDLGEKYEDVIYKMANDLNLEMNEDQGLFQVSGDKKLIQCSTKADYWNGERKNYIEFVRRIDGRDGFEGKNAYGNLLNKFS